MSTVAATSTEETNVAGTATAPDTDEEPQNSLTQKFTDKEWAALKEFRVRAVEHQICVYSLLHTLSAPPPRNP